MLKYKESLSLALLDHEDQMEILDLLAQQVQRESEEKEETRVLLVLQESRDVSSIYLNMILLQRALFLE